MPRKDEKNHPYLYPVDVSPVGSLAHIGQQGVSMRQLGAREVLNETRSCRICAAMTIRDVPR